MMNTEEWKKVEFTLNKVIDKRIIQMFLNDTNNSSLARKINMTVNIKKMNTLLENLI